VFVRARIIGFDVTTLTLRQPSRPSPSAGAPSPTVIDTPHRRAAVEVGNVTKSFGRQVAVRDLSLLVPERTICGFIGPNGSGKTTTLRMIMGIYYPDYGSGGIRVLGQEVLGSASDRVGYLPEERGLYKQIGRAHV